MTKLSICAVACFCLLLLSVDAPGQEVVYDLPKLINTSDLVAVAQVEAVSQTASGTIEFPWGQSPAHFRVVTLGVRDVLKGARPSADIQVRYTRLYSPAGWSGGVPSGYTIADTLTPNSTRLVFLKSVGDHYEFTNGSYLAIVCAPEPPSSDEPADTFNRVLSRVEGALLSPSVPQQEKAEAIRQLGAVNTDSVIPALRTFLLRGAARKDEFLRIEALVALLDHKDESVVEAAESELLSKGDAYWKSNLLFAIQRAISPSRSIPIITKALHSSSREMRISAAIAIYQTNSAAGIPPLLRALEDPDPDVAFAVMQGLGNLTQDYEGRPKSTQPDADWFRCLNHWRNYRQRGNNGE